jgi:hypothetical protein
MQEKDTCRDEKKPYVKPELKTHGDVATLTQHHDKNDHPDHPDHGPASHLF